MYHYIITSAFKSLFKHDFFMLCLNNDPKNRVFYYILKVYFVYSFLNNFPLSPISHKYLSLT